jgi:hypothetical protein
MALALVHLHEQRPFLGRRAAPPGGASAGDVGAWVGAAGTAEGGRLHVSLAPLHSDPTRQRFEADSLASRLELDGGEPWRLVLRYVAEAGAELELERMAVSDGAGGLLRPLPAPGEVAGVADPLAVLLAAPKRLRAGSARTLVLWGDAPGEDAHLEVSAADGALAVPLGPGSVDHSELDGCLARVERFSRLRRAEGEE